MLGQNTVGRCRLEASIRRGNELGRAEVRWSVAESHAPNLTRTGAGCITRWRIGTLELANRRARGRQYRRARFLEGQRQNGAARLDVTTAAELARDRVNVHIAI